VIHTHRWVPWRPAVEFAERLADGKSLVVELGPGKRPFRPATQFVGRPKTNDVIAALPEYAGTFHDLDLSRDELPWGDGEVDFLYTRHTLEDLDDPIWCLREIQRVAKSGYIETPSVINELCRGVDAPIDTGERAPWRGYHHHRSFVWSDGKTLQVCPKYHVIEHVQLTEQNLYDKLNEGPLYWNTYFWWEGRLPFKAYQHELDFEIGHDYGMLLTRAADESANSCAAFGEMCNVR